MFSVAKVDEAEESGRAARRFAGRGCGRSFFRSGGTTHLSKGEEILLQFLPLGGGLLALPPDELQHLCQAFACSGAARHRSVEGTVNPLGAGCKALRDAFSSTAVSREGLG